MEVRIFNQGPQFHPCTQCQPNPRKRSKFYRTLREAIRPCGACLLSRPARRPTPRGWRQPRRVLLSPHSHSIINEPSKLLIRKVVAATPQTFTVIFTVNLSGTSIGAGFRAIRPKVTFRDLSTSIDSHAACQFHRRAPVPVGKAPQEGARIKYVKSLSRHAFSPIFLPSRCRTNGEVE